MRNVLVLLGMSVFLCGWGDWDGEAYANSRAPGKLDGFGAISRLQVGEGGSILDVGCGDGGITALIAERFPLSRVIGIDLSPSMIHYANKTHGIRPHLSFQVGDARRLDVDQEFDLIVSFGTMHWIEEQAEALASFHRALKPGGNVFIQIPLQLPAPFHDALQKMLTDSNWAPYFVDYVAPWTFYHLGEYLFFLYDAGFSLRDMRVFISDEVFPTREAFQECLGGWLPFLEVIPENLKSLFLAQLVDSYVVLAPPDEKGQVYFQEPLLEVECISD